MFRIHNFDPLHACEVVAKKRRVFSDLSVIFISLMPHNGPENGTVTKKQIRTTTIQFEKSVASVNQSDSMRSKITQCGNIAP